MEPEDKNPLEHYKLGVFYYDPKDKRLFVPQTIGHGGQTFNYGNYWAIVISVIIVVAVTLAILGKLHIIAE
jgi:uncharacterized membrane protein